MTVHERAAKTYKTLNDAGRSHDECLREAVTQAVKDALRNVDEEDWRWLLEQCGWGGRGRFWRSVLYDIRALSYGGQKND